MVRTFWLAVVLLIGMPLVHAQTLLKDTGRGIVNAGKAAGRLTGKAAVKAGHASASGGKKAANFSARKVSQGTAKLEEKTR